MYPGLKFILAGGGAALLVAAVTCGVIYSRDTDSSSAAQLNDPASVVARILDRMPIIDGYVQVRYILYLSRTLLLK
jgi:hypothetical protein